MLEEFPDSSDQVKDYLRLSKGPHVPKVTFHLSVHSSVEPEAGYLIAERLHLEIQRAFYPDVTRDMVVQVMEDSGSRRTVTILHVAADHKEIIRKVFRPSTVFSIFRN